MKLPAPGRIVLGRMFGLAEFSSGGSVRRVELDEVFLPSLPHAGARVLWHRGHLQLLRLDPALLRGVTRLGRTTRCGSPA